MVFEILNPFYRTSRLENAVFMMVSSYSLFHMRATCKLRFHKLKSINISPIAIHFIILIKIHVIDHQKAWVRFINTISNYSMVFIWQRRSWFNIFICSPITNWKIINLNVDESSHFRREFLVKSNQTIRYPKTSVSQFQFSLFLVRNRSELFGP